MPLTNSLKSLGLSNLHKQHVSASLIVLISLAAAMSAGCGKRKPPLPPTERVVQRVEATGFQRGNSAIISWKMPARNAPSGSILNIARADIYRLAEPLDSPQALSEEEFASRSVLVAAIPVSESDFGLKTMSYTDTLQFAGQAARLRYAVRFVNSSGQKAAFSNFFLLEPASRVALPPASLSAEITQAATALTWLPPAANVDGSTPANVLGYNVYRSTSLTEPAELLNNTPVTQSRFEDRFFEFNRKYYYFVRAVSLGTDGMPVESSESNIERTVPKDTFAPTAPAAITLAATPATISIFFAINPEPDIAGYRIYKSDDATKPKSEWELLTKDLLVVNTFQDDRVVSGKAYFYFITATDKFGNVSEPSEVVSETVP